jgi:hypothetical protein
MKLMKGERASHAATVSTVTASDMASPGSANARVIRARHRTLAEASKKIAVFLAGAAGVHARNLLADSLAAVAFRHALSVLLMEPAGYSPEK